MLHPNRRRPLKAALPKNEPKAEREREREIIVSEIKGMLKVRVIRPSKSP